MSPLVTKRTTYFKSIDFTLIHRSITLPLNNSAHFHPSSYSTCKMFILLTFATSWVTGFFFITSVSKAQLTPFHHHYTLQTAERSAVMWLMELESACVRGKVIFPMAKDVFIRSKIQVSQSNSITSPHTLWSSLRERGLILGTMFFQQTEKQLLDIIFIY